MTRLIDADALLKELKDYHFASDDYIVETITNATTVQREGWVSVPIEPDKNMMIAPSKEMQGFSENVARQVYKAMLSAAPTDTE